MHVSLEVSPSLLYSRDGDGGSGKMYPSSAPLSRHDPKHPKTSLSEKPVKRFFGSLFSVANSRRIMHMLSRPFFMPTSILRAVPRKRDYVEIDDKAIGRRLREARTHRGLSQVQLAEKIGMDQSLLSRYERGELRLHAALIVSLATVLRTSADELLGLKPSKNNHLLEDRRFLRRVHLIDGLSRRKKDALLTTIDSFLQEQR